MSDLKTTGPVTHHGSGDTPTDFPPINWGDDNRLPGIPQQSGDWLDKLHERVHNLEQLLTSPQIMLIGPDGKLTIPDPSGEPDAPITVIDPNPPHEVTGLVAIPGTYLENIFVDVLWDEFEVTDQYLVELSTAHHETIPGPGGGTETTVVDDLVATISTQGHNYRFNALIPNQIYVVRVTPLSKIGVRGDTTNWVEFTTGADTTIPAQIEDVWIGQGTGAAVVKFSDSLDADVGRGHGLYEVEIDSNDSFDNTDGLNQVTRTTAVVVSFDIPTVRTNFFARVRAIDSSGNEGPWSDTAGPSVAGSVIDSMVVGDLNAAKITFGTMSGDRITANTLDIIAIKTSTLHAATITIDGFGNIRIGDPPTTGMIITSQGLFLYNDETITISLDATTGQAYFQGTVNATIVNGSIVTASVFDGGTTQEGTIEACTMNASEINGTNIYGSFIAADSAFVWATGFIDNPSGLAMNINAASSYELGRGIHWTSLGTEYGDVLDVLWTIDVFEDTGGGTHMSMGTTSTTAIGSDAELQFIGGKIAFADAQGDLMAFFASHDDEILGPTFNFAAPGISAQGQVGETNAALTLWGSESISLATPLAGITGDLFVTGSFTAGSKSFVIDHPTKDGMVLEHATLEGPEHGVYYRGTAKLQGGEVTVQLPAYFEKLTLSRDRTVQLTPVMHSAASSAVLAASVPKQGKFNIVSSDPKDQREVFWCVQATRSGVTIEVERPKDVEREEKIAARTEEHMKQMSQKASTRATKGKSKKLQVVRTTPPSTNTPDKEHTDAVRAIAASASRSAGHHPVLAEAARRSK